MCGMLHYQNLTIIGTSHIAIESVNEVREQIVAQKPQVVAVELDKLRVQSLMSEEKRGVRLSDIRQLGVKGFVFNLIGAYAEKKMGDIVNVKPGAEMKEAILTANQIKADVALVDQDVRITMKRLSKEVTWKEKGRFVWDIMRAGLGFGDKMKIDLRKVPDKKVIQKLTAQLKKRYPSVYKVLIVERNEVIAKNLYMLMQRRESVLAVIGAGHEDEVVALIRQHEVWNGPKKR